MTNLEQAYGVSFRAEGGGLLVDDACARIERHTGSHPRLGPDATALPD